MTPDPKAAARLKSIYKDFKKATKGNQAAFAELCGVSQPSINRMMNGTQPITLEVLKACVTKLNYHPTWILTGEPPMKRVEEKKSLRLTDFKTILIENQILSARITAIERKQDQNQHDKHN